MNLLMFLGGLILLIIGANALVRGASKLAMSFGTTADLPIAAVHGAEPQ